MIPSLSDLFLTGLVSYGATVFGLSLFLSGLGFPLPGTLLVVAAGAFTSQGYISWQVLLLGLLAVIVGDSLSFAAGRYSRGWFNRRLGDKDTWKSAESFIQRRGFIAVFLSRFLLTPLALPVNLIAGASGYEYRRFLPVDILGELTWVIGYALLGYFFAASWETVSDLLGNISGVALGVFIILAGYSLYRRRINAAAIRAARQPPVRPSPPG